MKEIRGYKKKDMLYPDRCMLKWRGMLLSDHSEMMLDNNMERTMQKTIIEYDEQEKERFDQIILTSLGTNKQVTFTINKKNTPYYTEQGVVTAIKKNMIFLESNGNTIIIKKGEILKVE